MLDQTKKQEQDKASQILSVITATAETAVNAILTEARGEPAQVKQAIRNISRLINQTSSLRVPSPLKNVLESYPKLISVE